MTTHKNFVPPPMPILSSVIGLREKAELLSGGSIDLSVGNPIDPVPDIVVESLKDHDLARPYPLSAKRDDAMSEVINDWTQRQLKTTVHSSNYGICIGTKEFVAGAPNILKLRDSSRDTVLYPEVAYPSYEMGAELAGCRAVPVALSLIHI